jgi:outer membrane protein
MKNISLMLNAVLLLLIGHLYYLHYSTPAAGAAIVPPASVSGGVKIAYVNADTLDAKYEWLKQQKDAIEQRARNAQTSLGNKKDALERELAAFQEKYQAGNTPPAELEKQYAALQQRGQKLQEEEMRLSQSLSDDQKKAFDDLYANVEAQLKTLSAQIGYDYILSYSRGGQILLANDSLDITREVLQLLNAKEPAK